MPSLYQPTSQEEMKKYDQLWKEFKYQQELKITKQKEAEKAKLLKQQEHVKQKTAPEAKLQVTKSNSAECTQKSKPTLADQYLENKASNQAEYELLQKQLDKYSGREKVKTQPSFFNSVTSFFGFGKRNEKNYSPKNSYKSLFSCHKTDPEMSEPLMMQESCGKKKHLYKPRGETMG